MEEIMKFPCKGESELSRTEKATISYLKNQSMVIGLGCILLTGACSFLVVLPWSKWCSKRSQISSALEEAILEQTEVIVRREMEKAAADYVTKSLSRLTAGRPALPDRTETEPEDGNKTGNGEKTLLNVNDIDWEKIGGLANVLIESLPNKTQDRADES
ncbi:uncharacterized protein LOC144539833 [Centroberyx gerrardi]